MRGFTYGGCPRFPVPDSLCAVRQWFRPFRAGKSLGIQPRALPWAITFRPFRAALACGLTCGGAPYSCGPNFMGVPDSLPSRFPAVRCSVRWVSQTSATQSSARPSPALQGRDVIARGETPGNPYPKNLSSPERAAQAASAARRFSRANCSAYSGRENHSRIQPRALPWAITACPFRAALTRGLTARRGPGRRLFR